MSFRNAMCRLCVPFFLNCDWFKFGNRLKGTGSFGVRSSSTDSLRSGPRHVSDPSVPSIGKAHQALHRDRNRWVRSSSRPRSSTTPRAAHILLISFANLLHLGRVSPHLINACLWLWLRGRDCRISHTSVSGFEVTGQTLLKTRVRVGRDRKIIPPVRTVQRPEFA
jgi:hypothetical protein